MALLTYCVAANMWVEEPERPTVSTDAHPEAFAGVSNTDAQLVRPAPPCGAI